VCHLIGLQNGFGAVGFKWDSQDAIAVVIIDNEDAIVASGGSCHKFAS